jgi:LmbE family N-acetylglucosaminyl deacetylase
MDEKNNVLVVTPHPDDAEGGAGGTIAKWTSQGRDVVLVVTTDGRHGTSDRSVDPAELARTREKEQRNAADVLGISEVVFLRFPDQGLVDGPELRERIVREIRRHRPDTVVTIDPNRRYIRHRDHMVTGRVTLDAVFPYARDHLAFPQHLEEGLEPHKVREVYLWSSEEPDTFLDITDTFDTKMKALYCHVSQVGEPSSARRERSMARHREVGKRVGVDLAEQFKRIEVWR